MLYALALLACFQVRQPGLSDRAWAAQQKDFADRAAQAKHEATHYMGTIAPLEPAPIPLPMQSGEVGGRVSTEKPVATAEFKAQKAVIDAWAAKDFKPVKRLQAVRPLLIDKQLFHGGWSAIVIAIKQLNDGTWRMRVNVYPRTYDRKTLERLPRTPWTEEVWAFDPTAKPEQQFQLLGLQAHNAL